MFDSPSHGRRRRKEVREAHLFDTNINITVYLPTHQSRVTISCPLIYLDWHRGLSRVALVCVDVSLYLQLNNEYGIYGVHAIRLDLSLYNQVGMSHDRRRPLCD